MLLFPDPGQKLARTRVCGNLYVSLCLAVLTLSGLPEARAQTPVAIELVLAVDASASVDEQERLLQQQAYVRAFRDPGIHKAIEALAPGGLAVTYLEWSSRFFQVQAVGWRHIRSAAEVVSFAREIAEKGGQARASGTAIGEAVISGVELIDRNGFQGARRIIDVSADDRYNSGSSPTYAQVVADRAGVTVNGLAIDPHGSLTTYFREKVITGPGAFVIRAGSYAGFSDALKKKLLRELKGHAPVARLEAGRIRD